ncbi:MAG TPA: toll/interleukin-1 receptor domain-containing protein [Pirellulales bacterium]|nr:toll/interleukin-1 receptor domain-containing protein [Pirellulales bacterium]
MKVFLSHARKDSALARQLADCLTRADVTIWIADDEIVPGENWAKKVGKALDAAELMVILLTPRALESDSVRQDIEFALTSRKLEGRVFTVFVGPTLKVVKDIPWILRTLPHQQVESAQDFPEIAKEIQRLASGSSVSHSNA